MGVNLRIKNGRYYLDIYFHGRRRWEALGLSIPADPIENKNVKRLAEVIRSKREQQLISGEWGLLDPIEGKKSLVVFAEELSIGQAAKNPLPKSLRYLRAYAGTIAVGAISEKWVEGYRSYLLQEESIGPATASKYFSALVYVLKRAVRDRIIPRNPAEGIKSIAVPEVVKVYLEPHELDQLAATPLGGELGGEIKRAFLFAYCTGLRISDLKSLSWGDIQVESKRIVKRQVKTKRVVGAPLNESAMALIRDNNAHNACDSVFPKLAATKANTNQYLVNWAMAAGIQKHIGWHTARHTFATLSMDSGADISTTSRLLGHTKIQTTAIYAKTTDRAKREAVAKLHPVSISAENENSATHELHSGSRKREEDI